MLISIIDFADGGLYLDIPSEGGRTVQTQSLVSSTIAITMLFAQPSCTPDKAPSSDIDVRLSRLVLVPMEFDSGQLSGRERELVSLLVEAGKLMHEAYLRQYYPPGVSLRDSLRLIDGEKNASVLRLVVRNGGPFDKMDHSNPFIGTHPRPEGGGYYPTDLTKEEFERYVADHPREKKALMSPYTVVRREGDQLRAVPFHVEYQQWMKPASDLLKRAADLAENESLRKFLRSRADALLTDDYYQSDLDWIDVTESNVDITIGPYEVYDDGLMALKASYEVTVGVREKEESDRLTTYTRHLEQLEEFLPHDSKFKRSIRGLISPMVVVTDVYRGGDIATGYQPVAANLPNDPRVHTTKGTRKTFWKNMMEARVRHVIMPIGRELIASDQVRYITPEGLFSFVLLHELSHALGPRYVHGTADSVSVNQAMKDLYPGLEEGKADVAGLHCLVYFLKAGIISADMEREHYVSYLASLFRTIRFGTGEAHGQAAMCQINYLWEKGGIHRDSASGKWSVRFEKIGAVISDLAKEWLTIQATGDYEAAEKFFGEWGRVPKEISDALLGLDHLPVDVEPVYVNQWN